jgi:hypothetical protein
MRGDKKKRTAAPLCSVRHGMMQASPTLIDRLVTRQNQKPSGAPNMAVYRLRMDQAPGRNAGIIINLAHTQKTSTLFKQQHRTFCR